MFERVVFDTNVWISGLLWRGKPYQCLLLARSGVVTAIVSQQILAELAEKLRHKFHFSEERIQDILNDIRKYSDQVKPMGELQGVVSDPDDDMVIECALVAGATVIVSGDRHLLALAKYQEIDIISPEELRAILRAMAQRIPPGERRNFLEQLTPPKEITTSSEDALQRGRNCKK